MSDPFDSVKLNEERSEMTSLLTIVGFACFLTWLLMALAGNVFNPGNALHFDELFVRLVTLATMALTQLAMHLKLASWLSEYAKTKRLLALVIVLALPMMALSIVEQYTVLFIAFDIFAWAMLGISMGILFLAWGSIWSGIDRESTYNSTTAKQLAWSLLLVAALSLFVKLAPDGFGIPLVFAIYLGSAILQMTCSIRLSPNEREEETESAPGKKLHLFSKSRYTPLAMGLFFGFTLAFAISSYDVEITAFAIVGSVFLGAAASAFIIVVLHRVPRITTVERVLFPFLAACFLCTPFLEEALRIYPLSAAVAALTFYFLSHWNVLLMVAYKHELAPIFHFSQGMIAPLEGMAIGWGAQTLFTALDYVPDQTILGSFLTLTFLTVFIPALVSYKSNPAVEVLSIAEDGSLFILADGVEEGTHPKGNWKQRCLKICKEYDLSPRETEVFMLLAKGRNAEHIHNELFISVYTAKTHGYRIYRKLNVHSQQELIDLVEDNKPE